ncbi:MAG: hypothetical protein Q4G60_13290 [bacterium]|nr:hypothetical protein [bacterium]
MKIKAGKDLLLGFLYAPGKGDEINEPIWGRTRLEKMMFIFEKELAEGFYHNVDVALPEFIPYLYGPYSMELLDDLTLFIALQFINETETSVAITGETASIQDTIQNENDDLWDEVSEENPSQYEKSYSLSEIGLEYTEQRVWSELTDIQKSVIIRLKTQINNMLLDDLLNYVYNKYPEYAENSIIREKYLGKEIRL